LLLAVNDQVNAQRLEEFRLLSHQRITNFPSASTILYYEDRLFVTGDDSRDIMILDTQHRKIDSIRVFEGRETRVPRREKADIESSFLTGGTRKRIVLNGSGSSPKRNRSFVIPLRKSIRSDISVLENGEWLGRLDPSLRPINIEGSTLAGGKLVFGNRRQTGGRENFLIITNRRSFLRGMKQSPSIVNVLFPDSISLWAGISDLVYVAPLDILLVTFSSERSPNPTEDGEIGDSYLGWVSDFRRKLRQNRVGLSGLVDLAVAAPVFRSQKIEGICVESRMKKRLIIHLVSDNDDGESQVFRASLTFE
jgi:hypothetical protein